MTAISVIIPTYNCARFLPESLASVFAQTERDLEVIVVDDGSSDDTRAVLSPYASRLTVIHRAHAGLAAARNAGLERAQGHWIAFHDADDVALPDRLTLQRAFLERHPGSDALFCNGERMDSRESLVAPAVARRCRGRPLTAADLFAGYPVYFQGALVAREVFRAVGPFNVGLRVHPDIEYGYRLFARSRAIFLDRVVFRYRWHTTNNSADRLGGREDIVRILDRLRHEDAEAVRLIGARRLRFRLARHYYRIARQRVALGHTEEARAAVRHALALRPLHPRYRLLQLWQAR